VFEAVEASVLVEQRVEQLFGSGSWQDVESQLLIVGFASPGVRVLGAVADRQEKPRPSAHFPPEYRVGAWVSESIQWRSSKTSSTGGT